MAPPTYSQTLQTPRLVVQLFNPSRPEHYTDQLSFMNSATLNKLRGPAPTITAQDIDDKANRHYLSRETCTKLGEEIDPPSHPYHLIYLRDSDGKAGTYIGGVSLFHRKKTGLMPDLGWGLLSDDYEGKGYGTEAVRAVLDFWREEIGVQEIWALTGATKMSSRRLCEKIGFIDGGVLTLKMRDGEIKDLVAFMLPGMSRLEGNFQTTMQDLM